MIPAIGLASGIGGRHLGAGEGPLLLQKHLGPDISWHKMVTPKKGDVKDRCAAIANLNRQLAAAAYSLAQREPFFLSVGGDHSCAIGTWSGVAAAKKEPIGLLWIDAHMDAHTHETTETGNIHGMPLAALLGYGDARLTQIAHPFPKLYPQNTALIGIRSFESGEAELLRRLNVRIFFMDEVKKRGLDVVMKEARDLVTRNTVGYGVSFDLDSIEPSHIQAVGTPEPGGIDPDEMLAAFSLFKTLPPLAFELVEYIPALDEGLKTLQYVQRLVQIIAPEVSLTARS